jgi:hypothetical protein
MLLYLILWMSTLQLVIPGAPTNHYAGPVDPPAGDQSGRNITKHVTLQS